MYVACYLSFVSIGRYPSRWLLDPQPGQARHKQLQPADVWGFGAWAGSYRAATPSVTPRPQQPGLTGWAAHLLPCAAHMKNLHQGKPPCPFIGVEGTEEEEAGATTGADQPGEPAPGSTATSGRGAGAGGDAHNREGDKRKSRAQDGGEGPPAKAVRGEIGRRAGTDSSGQGAHVKQGRQQQQQQQQQGGSGEKGQPGKGGGGRGSSNTPLAPQPGAATRQRRNWYPQHAFLLHRSAARLQHRSQPISPPPTGSVEAARMLAIPSGAASVESTPAGSAPDGGNQGQQAPENQAQRSPVTIAEIQAHHSAPVPTCNAGRDGGTGSAAASAPTGHSAEDQGESPAKGPPATDGAGRTGGAAPANACTPSAAPRVWQGHTLPAELIVTDPPRNAVEYMPGHSLLQRAPQLRPFPSMTLEQHSHLLPGGPPSQHAHLVCLQ